MPVTASLCPFQNIVHIPYHQLPRKCWISVILLLEHSHDFWVPSHIWPWSCLVACRDLEFIKHNR